MTTKKTLTKKTLSMTREDFVKEAIPKIMDYLETYESWDVDSCYTHDLKEGIVFTLTAGKNREIWCGLDKDVPELFDWLDRDMPVFQEGIACEDMGNPYEEDDRGAVWISETFCSPSNGSYRDICWDLADKMYDYLEELLNEN